MPYISDWEKPPVAFLIDGFPIYHAYRNDSCTNDERMVMDHTYQVLPAGVEGWDPEDYIMFGIDEIPEYSAAEDTKEYYEETDEPFIVPYDVDQRGYHKHIIRQALQSGSLADVVNDVLEFPLKERPFRVDVTRITSRTQKCKVKARSAEEAEFKALEKAGDFDFNQYAESEPEYEAEVDLWKSEN